MIHVLLSVINIWLVLINLDGALAGDSGAMFSCLFAAWVSGVCAAFALVDLTS